MAHLCSLLAREVASNRLKRCPGQNKLAIHLQEAFSDANDGSCDPGNSRKWQTTLSPQPVLDHLKLGAAPGEMKDQPGSACEFFLKTGTARITDYPYTGKPSEPKDVSLS
jgi:hypothetical protein